MYQAFEILTGVSGNAGYVDYKSILKMMPTEKKMAADWKLAQWFTLIDKQLVRRNIRRQRSVIKLREYLKLKRQVHVWHKTYGALPLFPPIVLEDEPEESDDLERMWRRLHFRDPKRFAPWWEKVWDRSFYPKLKHVTIL